MRDRWWIRGGVWALILLFAGCAARIDVGTVQGDRLAMVKAVKVLPLNIVETNLGEVVRDAVEMVLLQGGIRVLGPGEEAEGEDFATIAVTLTKSLSSYALSARVVHGGKKQEPLAVVTLSQDFSVFYEPSPSDLGRSLGLALTTLLKGGRASAVDPHLVAYRTGFVR